MAAGLASIALITDWPSAPHCRACSAVSSLIAAMSAPATNDLSPPPVSTTARTDSSAESSRAAASSPWLVSASSELSASGRLTVTTATAPSRTTSTAMETLLGPWDRTVCDQLYLRDVGSPRPPGAPGGRQPRDPIVNLYSPPRL